MGRKKKNIEDLKIVDGTTHVKNPSRVAIAAVDQLLNYSNCPFKTVKEDDYHLELKNLDVASLQEECDKHGLLWHESKPIMVERLMQAYRRWKSSMLAAGQPVNVPHESSRLKALTAEIAKRPVL